MSSIDCDNPGHERCERCGGCVPCGCLCHLAGGEDEEQASSGLVTLEMGLREFDLNSEERSCPKCGYGQMQVVFHPNVIFTLGETPEGSFPCGTWVMAGILSDQTTQHLCLRCLRCGYGYPTKTADAL